MNKQDQFVAYEYKKIAVKREVAEMYADCLQHFGWSPVDAHGRERYPSMLDGGPAALGTNIASFITSSTPEAVEGFDMVTLKFKRDRKLTHKNELDKLEQECENALATIGRLENRKEAQTNGTSIGLGILGTGFLALGIYNIISASMVLGIVLTAVGVVGWGIGFLASCRMDKNQAARMEPKIQTQLNIVYNACERAHALLAA